MTETAEAPVTRATATRVEGFICLSRELTWGWGATVEEAILQARRAAGGRGARKGDRLVVQMPVDSLDPWVDQMGAVNWTWAEDAVNRDLHTVTLEEPKDR